MCTHEHIRFEDGYFHVVCIDCKATWMAVTAKHGAPDTARAFAVTDPFRATRHDRWVLPRTEPLSKK